MRTGWTRTKKILATLALAAVGALAIGCGPAPGYEPEPRVPMGYAPPAESEPTPPTSEELAAQSQARAQAAGEVAVGEDADEYADTDPSALTEFKPALDGHGTWVDDPTYGTVWVPSESEVGTDFVPYTTAGHWTYDDDTSWVWVSDYSWGWAPFHYGRWVHARHHGWAWIPGRTYAGAWVTWRTGPGYDYVGWSPMGPDWYWYNGTPVAWTYGYSPYYSYCHRQYLYSPGVAHHVVRGPAAREHEGRTQPYVVASPAVAGGGRIAATPTVGAGRTPASPSVGGGRVVARPQVGPRPAELGIKPEMIMTPPRDNAGLARARVFAAPQTAVAQGAAPPMGARSRAFTNDAVAVSPARPSFDTRAPLMLGRYEGAPRVAPMQPQAQGPVTPVPPRQAALPELRPSPRGLAPSPGLASPAPMQQQPSFRAQPSVSSPPPSFRSSPSFAARPSPPPTFRAAPQPRISSPAPTFRSSPSPTFRSSPSVSSPSFRSAPAPRMATPSPSRPATPSVRSRR
jgi:hypothetical protein